MPQFDPANISPQLVWLVITFIIFMLLMARVGLPGVEQVLTKREERIADDLDNAQKMNEEAARVQAEHEAALAKSRSEAQAILAKASEGVNKRIDEAQADLNAKLNARLAEAEERVAKASAAAMKEVETIATDVATDVVAQLAGGTKADVSKVVGSLADGGETRK